MRGLLITAALVAAFIPGLAAADTIKEVIAHGEIVTIQGMDIDVKFTPDGKFTALDGQMTGTWKIDGDKLCTAAPDLGVPESCATYPKDKKSGDTFEVTSPDGAATVKIK